MKIIAIAIAAALAAAAALPAAAQQRLKPGLWEMTQKMQGNPQMDEAMAQMRKQLEAMPPEQRRQMEGVLAGRGMQMGAIGPGGMAVRVCLTKEMVERDDIPANSGDCRTTRQQRSGNTLKLAFACTQPPSSGETEMTVASPESFTSRTRATTAGNGRQETVTVEGSGRWLSADCGNVRPMAAPPAR